MYYVNSDGLYSEVRYDPSFTKKDGGLTFRQAKRELIDYLISNAKWYMWEVKKVRKLKMKDIPK